MMTEKQICCICFNIASDGSKVDGDILDLLKFIIAHIKTSALENSTVCNGCLNIILEICNYKTRNSLKTLVETTIETDSEKPRCQKCEKTCEGEDTFPLMNSVTQIDWSDFVNYLFPDQDSQSLESSQICDSCRISVSNIQRFLMLICIHDPSKVKCAIDYGDDIKTTGNQTLVGEIVEVKEEFENVIDKETEIKNVIEDNKTEIICIDDDDDDDDDNATYADFKCKNEEVELKLEEDDNQSTFRCEKIDVGRPTDAGDFYNSFDNQEEQQAVNSPEGSNKLKYDLKVQNNMEGYKYSSDSTKFVNKCTDGSSSKIYKCDICNFLTAQETDMLKHMVKHNVKIKGLKKRKCPYCIYKTYNNRCLIKHTKAHNLQLNIYKCRNCEYETYNNYHFKKHTKMHDIREFKCTFCSIKFIGGANFDNHLLNNHKHGDNVTRKVYDCDKCAYTTTKKEQIMRHNINHEINSNLKC